MIRIWDAEGQSRIIQKATLECGFGDGCLFDSRTTSVRGGGAEAAVGWRMENGWQAKLKKGARVTLKCGESRRRVQCQE